jgi:TrpR-related protein YerC/YecD
MDTLSSHDENIKNLCQAVLLLDTAQDVFCFLKDICTPAELTALSERWQICQLLNDGLSYRDIHQKTGASLTTIGRVARFLQNEPYQGYVTLLKKLKEASQ